MRGISRYRPSPAMVVALLALGVAAGGVAFAAIPDSSGTIHGCYQRNSGDLRVVDSAADCHTGENALTWNQQGPPGPAGGQIVASLRGTATVDLLHAGALVPFSHDSWTQPPGEFEELHVFMDAKQDELCGVTVRIFLDGKLLKTTPHFDIDDLLSQDQADRAFDFPLFESGDPQHHTLSATLQTDSRGCGSFQPVARGGTVTIEGEVLGFR